MLGATCKHFFIRKEAHDRGKKNKGREFGTNFPERRADDELAEQVGESR